MPTAADRMTAQSRPLGESAALRLLADEPCYVCPGEIRPISRAVHLSRLAAYYPGCRQCAHRHDTGHLPRQIVERIDRTARRVARASLLADEGVRGVYLNELSRPVAERYAAAFASLLWEQQPLIARQSEEALAGRRRGPAVVVGHDSRPSSPDIVVGAAVALRRMGCHVIDIGAVSTPCLWFAVDHLQAAGAVYVTGHGCGPASTGFDFVESQAVPWSRGGMLDRLQERFEAVPARPTRSGGGLRTFRATVPYAAGLWKHFHALRPLRIGIACAAPLVTPLLAELFAQLPCTPHSVEVPVADDPRRVAQLAAERLAGAIGDRGLHAGLLIGEDGQQCRVFDERGVELDAASLCRAFARLAREECDAPVVVLDDSFPSATGARGHAWNCRVESAAHSREALSRRMHASRAVLGAQADGRYWFHDGQPVCDAVVTLARLLQALSRGDAPASALRADLRASLESR
jgi:phosphomannomutase